MRWLSSFTSKFQLRIFRCDQVVAGTVGVRHHIIRELAYLVSARGKTAGDATIGTNDYSSRSCKPAVFFANLAFFL